MQRPSPDPDDSMIFQPSEFSDTLQWGPVIGPGAPGPGPAAAAGSDRLRAKARSELGRGAARAASLYRLSLGTPRRTRRPGYSVH
eukprot:713420-Hanusia_phi.AAC.1